MNKNYEDDIEDLQENKEIDWFHMLDENELLKEELEIWEELEKEFEKIISKEEDSSYEDEEYDIFDVEYDEMEEDSDELEDEFDNEFNRKKFSQSELKEMSAITDLITSNQFIWKVNTKALLTAEQEQALFERMHSSYNKKEIDTIKRFIVEKNIGLVVHFAKKIKQTTWGRKMKFEDLVQEWIIGLYSGINRFDYKKWFKLSTYATWYVRQKMQEYTSDNMFPVRITWHRMRELQQINKIREEFSKENHREPTIDEIQAITWWPTSRMRDLANLMNWYLSLNDVLWWDSWDWKSTYWDMLESEESIEKDFWMSEIMNLIQKSMCRLTPREKHLFQLFFWFEDWKIISEWIKFWDLEKITWISRIEIRKSIKKARIKVTEELIKHGVDYWDWFMNFNDEEFE